VTVLVVGDIYALNVRRELIAKLMMRPKRAT